MAASLFWYDIETFGRNPQLDRLAQFAGLRTDDHFAPLEHPLLEYVAPASDYVPDPHSCLVTGITPADTRDEGISEYELASRVIRSWLKPGTCVVGYNNLKFDDEFMRNVFYRNFFDPYLREYKNGNTRWDLINVVRAAHDLRPEGMEWPRRDDGKPSFRLEELTEANGIGHENAHDALADVYATMGVAKLILEKQPRLFKFLFDHRRKDRAAMMINLHTRKPLLHTDGIYTREEGCTTAVAPLAVDPGNRNNIICFDMRHDPRPLLTLSVEELRERVFTSAAELTVERIPLRTIPLNKCPVLSPLNTLDEKSARRLGIDREAVHQGWKLIQEDPHLTEKVRAVYDRPRGFEEVRDPDLSIYSGGFFSDADKRLFDHLHTLPPDTWLQHNWGFNDARAEEMLRRLVGRSFPHHMNLEEQKRWKNFCATRLLFPPGNRIDDFGTFEKKLTVLSQSPDLSGRDKVIIRKLSDYKDTLKETILGWHGQGETSKKETAP